jgi:hypothetical protein
MAAPANDAASSRDKGRVGHEDLSGKLLTPAFDSVASLSVHASARPSFLSKKITFAFTPGEYQMPVGRRSSVWTRHFCSRLRRTFSLAPPSNSTLSSSS